MREISAPLSTLDLAQLQAGDMVLVNGVVYTARDAAHARIVEALTRGESPPFELAGQIIYYTGPCPAPPGMALGSCGPTTSGRMDVYTPRLIEAGIRAMIGKGERSPEVIESMRKHGAVYLATVGGAGALLAGCIRRAEPIAYHELGTEAVFKLEVDRLPCVVAIDSRGGNLYHIGKHNYRIVRENNN